MPCVIMAVIHDARAWVREHRKEPEAPVCEFIQDCQQCVMVVDGVRVPLIGMENIKYFRAHYTGLRYQVIDTDICDPDEY